METTTPIPDDPALPALAAIRSAHFAATLPNLGLDGGSVELRLRGYTPGARATIEARAGDRHFAVKAYAKDPSAEAVLYRALADAGLAGSTGVRVPRLLAWDRDLRMIVISWLAGRSVEQLITEGDGRRAGMLAAAFLRRAASLSVKLGPTFDPGELLFEVGKWVARLVAAEPPLGHAADNVAKLLLAALPRDRHSRLMHGTLYARHILDLGDGPGVIDWQRFGQGPLELDAGTFLATISRLAIRDHRRANEVARAEEAFRAGTNRLLNKHSLAWYQATALLRHASKPFRSGRAEQLLTPDERVFASVEARGLVAEAGRVAEAIG
jgi:aminoglycoside phosphotransferase (APT) family kinase protein